MQLRSIIDTSIASLRYRIPMKVTCNVPLALSSLTNNCAASPVLYTESSLMLSQRKLRDYKFSFLCESKCQNLIKAIRLAFPLRP